MRKLFLIIVLLLMPFLSGCIEANAFMRGFIQGRQLAAYQTYRAPAHNYSQYSQKNYTQSGYNRGVIYSQPEQSEFPFGYNYQSSSDYPNYQPTEFGPNYQQPSFDSGEEPFGHNYGDN